MRLIIFAGFLAMFALAVAGQKSEEHFSIFEGNGKVADIDSIVKRASANDVVFLGELHDDSVGHALQFEIFKRLISEYSSERSIILSLEMFERDVQVVLDEYLAGFISENHFLASSRPWGNYKTDYRPLVELAKEKKLRVVAANAPRRYVNMVSRNGRESLKDLSSAAKQWIAPLPYAEPSEAYAKKFKALMGPSPEAQMGLENILSSQSLWDATMAYWIADSFKREKRALVVHLNGGFHTESRLGTVEHLAKYDPSLKAVVVTMRYEDDFTNFDDGKHSDIGDFVILTDAKQPRSKR